MQWISNYVKNGENCFSIGCYIGELSQKDWIQMDGIACMQKVAGCVMFSWKDLYTYLSMFCIVAPTSEFVAVCMALDG